MIKIESKKSVINSMRKSNSWPIRRLTIELLKKSFVRHCLVTVDTLTTASDDFICIDDICVLILENIKEKIKKKEL